MYERIRDDRSRRQETTGSLSLSAVTGAALILSGLVNVGVWAQEPDADTLTAKVKQINTNREWIHVPVNKSVLIETNLPAVRQQTLSAEIAQIQSISPTQVLVTGRSFGRTQVIIWSADGQQQVFDISVELELDLLTEAIKSVEPMARVEARPVMETVILTGTVPDAASADRIMQIASIFAPSVQNHLSVAGEQQVMLRCTVAEMSRSVVRQLGINGFWWGDNDIPFVNNIAGINPTSFGRPGAPIGANVPFVGSPTGVGGNSTLSFQWPNEQLQVFVQALNENGLLKVLSEPNLVTVSGRTASFLAGGEFPVPVPQTGSGGATTITIEYREFGTRLSFTPVVLDNQMIRLTVAPEVSELDFASGVTIAGTTVPGLNSRRAETTVECGSGQTLAIAGLLGERVRAIADSVPGLGELPVLGALFSSTEFRKQLTELVILVTPEIVAPINPGEEPDLPGSDLVDPNDWQLYGLGMTSGGDSAKKNLFIELIEGPESASYMAPMGPYGLSETAEAQADPETPQ
jgi:pilus assembly protein CpaC